MENWWNSLESRERMSLLVLGAFLGLALTWVAVVDPLFSGTKRYAQRVATAEADIDYMRAAIPRLSTAGPTNAPKANEPLVVIVSRTLKNHNLIAKRQQPLDETSIRVQLDAVSFDSLVSWLSEVQREFGIDIDTATIKRIETIGAADANLTLSRAASGT